MNASPRNRGRWGSRLALASLGALFATRPVGAEAPRPEVDDGLDLFFRASDVLAVAGQELAHDPEADPGEAGVLARAFPGAPPQVPHSLEGLLPIRGSDNACLECHLPDEAEGAEAPAIPDSHFRRPTLAGTPGTPAVDNGSGMRVVVEGYRSTDTLSGFQYNCVQCHVPQADNVVQPTNTFTGGEVEAR